MTWTRRISRVQAGRVGDFTRRRYVRRRSHFQVSIARAGIFCGSATQLAALGLPTLFVLEGGYAVAEIGHNVAHVLRSFDDAAKAN